VIKDCGSLVIKGCGSPMISDCGSPVIRAWDFDDDQIEATRTDGIGRVRIYRPPFRAVVLGRGSKADLELNLENCNGDNVPLLRRRGGGCSVYIDEGNVIVSLAAPASGFGRIGHYFNVISEWLIDGLAAIGVPGVKQKGICDLVLDDRKIGGACLYRERDLLFYSTTLLVDPDLEKMDRYLKHPPREPDYREGRRHSAFVGTVLSSPLVSSSDMFEERLRNQLTVPACMLQ
jgi:lipoate-protein ligase A